MRSLAFSFGMRIMTTMCLGMLLGLTCLGRPAIGQDNPLLDWSDWTKYRHGVVHPCTTIKPEDVARAKENIRRHDWAKRYLRGLQGSADRLLTVITPEYLERMIEPTTPGCYGPCPACRDRGLPWHPNGLWTWSSDHPDQLKCTTCGTVFPNDKYPESVVLECRWAKGQRFTFIGGEPFRCFGYLARPSLSGIIRAKKVSHATSQLEPLSRAYILTGDTRYARATKAILLRFAEVFPRYLVRAGYAYGEYADMDPHVAARRINDLPEDELVVPPNKPNRKLHTGYWSASRIGTSGMDGFWVSRVTEAYDLTCQADDQGSPVYSEQERMRIEKDVLLEGAYLAACDTLINNKSVGNRAGAGMVGLCVGHPGLIRFGIEGLRRTVDEWFLPDGATSESPGYAMMTMSGIRPLAVAYRRCSDPPGYRDAGGKRLDDFQAYRDTRFGDCWQGLIWNLQGDLRFPPSADSYRGSGIGSEHAELIASAWPTPEHLALLRELAGAERQVGSPREALFYRNPEGKSPQAGPLVQSDVVFPWLGHGQLRTGEAGRDSLLLLMASDYGGHHHLDSLNLYYWKDGHELLSDLGYLWDHPDSTQTRRSFAHHLVMVDGRDQRPKGRGGRYELFAATPHVKTMEATSAAYPQATEYRRTCVLVDHGPAGSYAIDLFRVAGGKERTYVFHGPGKDYRVEGLAIDSTTAAERPMPAAVPSDKAKLVDLRHADGRAPWRILWSLEKNYQFQVLAPGQADEVVSIGQGWGQRDYRNSDRGTTLPYVLRQRSRSAGSDLFISVFEGSVKDRALVESVKRIPLPAGAPENAVVLAIQTREGVDLIVSQVTPQTLSVPVTGGELLTDARLAAVIARGNTPARSLPGRRHETPIAGHNALARSAHAGRQDPQKRQPERHELLYPRRPAAGCRSAGRSDLLRDPRRDAPRVSDPQDRRRRRQAPCLHQVRGPRLRSQQRRPL